MHETIDKILRHPIATVVIVSTVTSGIANVLWAARGKEPVSIVNFNVGKEPKSENT